MKLKITLFLLFITLISFSQSKEFIIIDNVTKKPIELVQVFYPELELGSVSNEDGKVRIPVKENKIVASHINYFKEEFLFKDFKEKDTLFLLPKNNQLEEVVLYNLNLKQKFEGVLNTYKEYYSTKKIVNNCTYKETFKVNDSIKRLFQVQLNWYSKNSLFKTTSPIEKQNVINVEAVDFSKISIKEGSFIDPAGGYVENKSFFRFLHLNYLLTILTVLTDEYEIETIQKNEDTENVYFNAVLKEKGKEVFKFKNSLVVFDKKYKTIKSLKLNMVYSMGLKEAISRVNKLPYKKKTKEHTVELSFKKLSNNKYGLGYFISDLKGVVKTKNYLVDINSKQSLFVIENRLGKKIRKGNVDFSKPIYESLSKDVKKKDVKILLTKREENFLKS